MLVIKDGVMGSNSGHMTARPSTMWINGFMHYVHKCSLHKSKAPLEDTRAHMNEFTHACTHIHTMCP